MPQLPKPSLSLPVDTRWYGGGLRFSCTGCGRCCTGGPGDIWVTPEEVSRVAIYLGVTDDSVIAKYCRGKWPKVSFRERRRAGGLYDCIFLSPEGRCEIYPARPLQCRTWPFWKGNLESVDSWTWASGRCPGVNQGKTYSPGTMEAIRDAVDWDDPGLQSHAPIEPGKPEK